MSSLTRPSLVPGAAVLIVGALALAPALVAPPVAVPYPVVHVADVALAGIGQNIYYAITPTVQYVVGGGSYLVNFIPLVGGPTAAQININYFQGIQPVVESTVNYLASVVQNPLNFFPITAAYGTALYDIGYNWVSAELRFLGLPALPPTAASVATPAVSRTALGPATRASAARTSAAGAASTIAAPIRRAPQPAAAADAGTAPQARSEARRSGRGIGGAGHPAASQARAAARAGGT